MGYRPKQQTIFDEVVHDLANDLNAGALSVEDGRRYAGGLVKFEPSEIARQRIPRLDELLNPMYTDTA